MSEHTLRSLFDLIDSNRKAREAFRRAMASASPADRPQYDMRIAILDQEHRTRLDTIEELPALLVSAPRLQEGWPYPSEEALQILRAELAHRVRRSVHEIEELSLREVVTLLKGRYTGPDGLPAVQLPTRTEIKDADVAALPRWARVAFAARCARRVQQMLAELASQAPPDELEGVERLVRLAEESAAEAKAQPGTAETAGEAMERAHRAAAPTPTTRGQVGALATPPIDVLHSIAASAAACAAWAATEDMASRAFDAYRMAEQAGYLLHSRVTLEGMRKDLLHLEAMARKEGWTDQTPVPPSAIPRPCLRLVGLHVRDLLAIRQLDLPRDGLGWQGQVPDLILLGGINGSGKTTLLNFLTDALALLLKPIAENFDAVLPKWLAAQEAWVDFELESYEVSRVRVRFLVGDEAFVEAHKTENCWWVVRPRNGGGIHGRQGNIVPRLAPAIEKWFREVTIPSVVFLPSEDRTLIVPGETYKAAGKLADDQQFVHRWRPPVAWKDSLEALLYSLRWEDLNASEQAPFTQMRRFDAYADAFRRFNGDAKYLKFEEGKLVVKVAGSTIAHDLDELSSGEKQVLLLSGELLRHWRPGSLILIDEPELHLHAHWQTRLYEALRYWQKERGGQVILATQSAHLAELAGPGSAVLLGMEPL